MYVRTGKSASDLVACMLICCVSHHRVETGESDMGNMCEGSCD